MKSAIFKIVLRFILKVYNSTHSDLFILSVSPHNFLFLKIEVFVRVVLELSNSLTLFIVAAD